MTRNALLKEYVAEIERLKADVLAAREKNGIFFSEETWNRLSAEQMEMEARKQGEIVESQLRSVREEFEQSIASLMKRDGVLKMTKERLIGREGELVEKVGELECDKGALEEEVVVRKAHQGSEDQLDKVATGLKHAVSESMNDLEGLFEKLGEWVGYVHKLYC
jgi:kinesin family member 11